MRRLRVIRPRQMFATHAGKDRCVRFAGDKRQADKEEKELFFHTILNLSAKLLYFFDLCKLKIAVSVTMTSSIGLLMRIVRRDAIREFEA